MLFQELGKLKRNMIMTSVIMMAVGILMFICPERHVSLLVAAAGYGLLVLATVMGFEFLSSKKVLINYAGDPGLAAHTGAGFPYWFCHRRMRGQEASGTQTFCLFPVKTEIESGNVPFDPFCGDSDATFPFFTLRIYPADTWKVICLR